MTPLPWAAERGHMNCVVILLRFGANAGLKSKFGKTPQDVSQDVGHFDIYDVLKVESNAEN